MYLPTLCSFPSDLDLRGRVPKTDPRNPLPESPTWTITEIGCWVLVGFLKPGASRALTPHPRPLSSWANAFPLCSAQHCVPLSPPTKPPHCTAVPVDPFPSRMPVDGAGHQGPRWNGRVRGASWDGRGWGQIPVLEGCRGRGQEQVIRNGDFRCRKKENRQGRREGENKGGKKGEKRRHKKTCGQRWIR